MSRNRSIEDLVQGTLARIRKGARLAAKGTAVAAGMALAATGTPGCAGDDAADTVADLNLSIPMPTAQSDDVKADWAQYEGVRSRDMVSYMGGYEHNYIDCGYRGGCMGVDVIVKVKIKKVDNAPIQNKRVGVVYKQLYGDPATALGEFKWDIQDQPGFEEWHVHVNRRSWEPGVLVFNAWYQDGLGTTYYDDNDGEFHVAAYKGNHSVLMHDWSLTKLKVTDNGVEGKIRMYVASLDYDKDLHMVSTTDGWQNYEDWGIGGENDNNSWHWVGHAWNGYEIWEMNVKIDRAMQKTDNFQYAIVYRHGVVGNAQHYDFWDNNGGTNYLVRHEAAETSYW